MILAMALALLAPRELPATEPAPVVDEPVRIWISNKGVFGSGDAVRVQIETGRAGHLLVLQLDPSGRVRVLFPVDPSDDALVQAGRRYEIRQPGEAASFTAAEGGVGLVYAALAEDPFRLNTLVTPEGTWSAGALAIARESQDPEAELTAIVQRIVSDNGFDYDVLDYQVAGRIAEQSNVPAWWSPAYGEVHDDCWGCGGWADDGVYVSVGFGFGWGWPYYYSPWYWGYGYYPGYYPPYWGGYYPPYYGGYYPPYYGGYYPSGYIKGRPRGYTVQPYGGEPRPHDGAGNAARGGTTSGAPARRARPPARGSDGGSTVQPNSGGSTGGKQPSAGGQSGSGKSGGSGSGGRARPRSGRPASESRIASEPWVERERPASRDQGGWVRIDDVTVPSRQDGARAVSSGETRVGTPVGRARATYSGTGVSRGVPEARRVTPSGGRTFGYSASSRARGGDPRQAAAAAQGGNRSGGGARPSAGGQRPGGSNAARPAPSGGSRSGGGASRPSGGGGGGRSRGRP